MPLEREREKGRKASRFIDAGKKGGCLNVRGSSSSITLGGKKLQRSV